MMQKGVLTPIKKENTIRKALKNVLKFRGFDKIRANIEGFETPSRLTSASDDISYVPDITAVKDDRKSYFELAVKSKKIHATLGKWRLLSTLAKLHNGKFYLIVPKGSYAFVSRLLSKHPIEAEVVKL